MTLTSHSRMGEQMTNDELRALSDSTLASYMQRVAALARGDAMNNDELRALAEAALNHAHDHDAICWEGNCPDEEFISATGPERIIALLDDRDYWEDLYEQFARLIRSLSIAGPLGVSAG